jgi:predicted thioesterase
MSRITVGTTREETLLVTSEVATDFLGMEEARVLATPWMILWMERTSRQAVHPLLDEGYDTVGTEVHVKHLAATPIGMSVTFRSEVIEVNDRRLTFKVEAWNEKEKVGEGTHGRVIINVAKFAAKLLAKENSQ